MTQITITEALAEIKTIKARTAKKRQAIMGYLARDAKVVDPMEKSSGGSVEYVRAERQAIQDLELRLVRIRTAIQRANLDSKLTLHGFELSVSHWLNWRRDVAADQKSFLTAMYSTVLTHRQNALNRGYVAESAVSGSANITPDGAKGLLVVNVDEKALLAESEQIETILGDLDGKLSLFNATNVIEIQD
jgi:hypothetical protein